MSTPSVPSPGYELFAPGDCNKPLPLNRITDTFRFSRFVGVMRVLDDKTVKAVIPRLDAPVAYARALALGRQNVTALDLYGGLPLDAIDQVKDLAAPLARSVQIDDLDAIIATRQMTVEGRQYRLSLDAAAIGRLLNHQDAVVAVSDSEAKRAPGPQYKPSLLRLIPKQAAPRPAALDMEIQDLGIFLARPEIPMSGGVPTRLALNADQIAALRKQGRLDVRVGDATVQLSVAQPADPQTPRYAIARPYRAGGSVGSSAPGTGTMAPPGGTPSTTGPTTSTSGGTVSPAPSFELVLNLQWIQTWELLGYSRGTLLNTVSLAPQEETTIEIFTWDRRKTSTEKTSTVESEESLDRSDTVRDTTDVLRQAQSDSEFGFHGDGTVGVNIYDVVKIGATVGASEKDSFAGLSKTSTNFIHEGVTKSANRVKESRQTKVSESEESGREERVTRKVRNANMCHTLNLDYFEVLANYSVTTKFSPADSGLCVLVDNPITIAFDRWALRIYEQALSRVLLDRTLQDGFAAARLLESRDQACAVLCAKCRCGAVTAPSDDAVKAVQDALNNIAARMATFENSAGYIDTWFEFMEQIDDASLRNPIYKSEARWWVYGELLRLGAPQLYTALLALYNAWRSKTPLTMDYAGRLRYELDAIGGTTALASQKLYNENKDHLIRSLKYEYEIFYQSHSNEPNLEDEYFEVMVNSTGLFDAFDDFGMVYCLNLFLTADDAANKAAGDAATALAQATEDENSRSDAVLGAFPLRDVTTALEREAALLAHLNIYGSYYRAMLWNSIPPMLQLQFIKSLLPLNIVEPHAVGFLGNQLAFPIKLEVSPEAQKLIADLITQNDAVQDLQRNEIVVLPTPAVTVEARLGQCDGCEEFIRKHRHLDLEQKAAEVKQARQVAEQEEQEARRFKMRLDANPADLEDPRPTRDVARLSVTLEQPPKPNP